MEEKMKENNHKKHLIKAYLDDSEYEKFISIAKATKRSNSRVVRDMLDNAIFVEYPPVEYGQVLRELRRIGINLNQISERAHSLNHIDSNAYRIDKNHLWRVVAEFAEMYLKCGALIEEEKVRQKSERRISFH